MGEHVMRAKMRVTQVIRHSGGQEELKLSAVCKSGFYDEGGLDEDNTFATYTPSADLTMWVNNPALYGVIIPDDVFYVDFTRVPKDDTEA